MKYVFHDGSLFVHQHETSASGLAEMIDLARAAAVNTMKRIGADHAIFAVKHYTPDTGELCEADIYCPAITLSDDEFQRRTSLQAQDSPGCYILAIHAR